MKHTFTGNITEGKLHIVHRSKFDSFIASCGWPQVIITIEKKRKKRSLPQNNYMWGCLYPAVQEGIKELWGESLSIEEVHYLMRMKFHYREIIDTATGEINRIPKSTTEFTTTDAMTYYMEIQKWALEYLGITIADPNEQSELEF